LSHAFTPACPTPPPPFPRQRPQSPAGAYRYAGGEFYNESVPADARYADFLYKLTEKFKTAVSVKYQCPGEDMDPTALITVADDDDFAVRGFAGDRLPVLE
jgi:hypothetical protein